MLGFQHHPAGIGLQSAKDRCVIDHAVARHGVDAKFVALAEDGVEEAPILGAGLALLAVFAAYYAAVVALLVITSRRRVALGLGTKAYWAIALDCILCPPFAVNLVRKITLQATTTAATP